MSRRILLVEDSDSVREAIEDFFVGKSGGTIALDVAANGIDGISKASTGKYDLAILDIMLPGASGYDVLRAYRGNNDTPAVFLTAKVGEDNILKGYEGGADDYIEKPFSLRVLYVKAVSMMDRYEMMTSASREKDEQTVIEAEGIRLIPSSRQVFAGEGEVVLANKEFALLKLLMENKGIVMTRDRILDAVWGDACPGDRVVDTHIKKIRKKLGDHGKAIKTVIGGGYRIV